ncbi:MAG TPA: NUDIX domain-containing protein [Solirubrobacteraceae bacterium]|nr:NUDIX domain-containing protein [Solirubrobacteraceae bacterium]
MARRRQSSAPGRRARGGRPPVERELSAGGVVVRDGECVVIVPRRRTAAGDRVLALPKGHQEPGESLEQAALREVREEGGVIAEVVGPLGDVRYWYQRDGLRVAKRVRFFLLAFRGGDPKLHDDEVEEARWMALAEAATALTHPGDRKMAALALSRAADVK